MCVNIYIYMCINWNCQVEIQYLWWVCWPHWHLEDVLGALPNPCRAFIPSMGLWKKSRVVWTKTWTFKPLLQRIWSKNVPFQQLKRDNGDKFTRNLGFTFSRPDNTLPFPLQLLHQWRGRKEESPHSAAARLRQRMIHGDHSGIPRFKAAVEPFLNLFQLTFCTAHLRGNDVMKRFILAKLQWACDVKNIHHIPSQFCCIVQRTIISCFWFCWHCSLKLREISTDHAKCSILLNVVNNSSVFTRQFPQQAAKIQWKEWI